MTKRSVPAVRSHRSSIRRVNPPSTMTRHWLRSWHAVTMRLSELLMSARRWLAGPWTLEIVIPSYKDSSPVQTRCLRKPTPPSVYRPPVSEATSVCSCNTWSPM